MILLLILLLASGCAGPLYRVRVLHEGKEVVVLEHRGLVRHWATRVELRTFGRLKGVVVAPHGVIVVERIRPEE